MTFINDALFWNFISRFGESEILLPVAASLALAMMYAKSYRACLLWLGGLLSAMLLTVATKIAFMGWGIGLAAWDFTGLSGHAVLSAAIYPVLGAMLGQRGGKPYVQGGAVLGYALAAFIAVSRVVIHAHSVSEAWTGFALGVLVSAWGIYLQSALRRPASPWLFVGIATWLAVMPVQARPSVTHPVITRLALALSHRAQPYMRTDLLRHLSIGAARRW